MADQQDAAAMPPPDDVLVSDSMARIKALDISALRDPGGDDSELRESMREFGWLKQLPAIADAEGIIVGHRRMRIAKELGIEPVIARIDFGEGDAAEVKRVRLAIVSNLGSRSFTRFERQRMARALYEQEADGRWVWSLPEIAKLLDSRYRTIHADISAMGLRREGVSRTLTPKREREILAFLAGGKTQAATARRFGVTPSIVSWLASKMAEHTTTRVAASADVEQSKQADLSRLEATTTSMGTPKADDKKPPLTSRSETKPPETGVLTKPELRAVIKEVVTERKRPPTPSEAEQIMRHFQIELIQFRWEHMKAHGRLMTVLDGALVVFPWLKGEERADQLASVNRDIEEEERRLARLQEIKAALEAPEPDEHYDWDGAARALLGHDDTNDDDMEV